MEFKWNFENSIIFPGYLHIMEISRFFPVLVGKDRRLSVLVGPTDGINLILNMDKYKKMSALISLYHAVFTFHTALLPTRVRHLGQLGKTGKLILQPEWFFD